MDRPEWVPGDVDVDKPSIARIWDWFLGGMHNFAIDREVAQATLELMPEGPAMAQINRSFLRRAVRYCTAAGITQFLDVGSGIPTVGNVHEIAQRAQPGARTVYVDIDPVAVAHTRRILTGDPHSGVIHADLRQPERILADPELGRMLDLDRPIALLMVAVLHFIPDADDPAGVLARYHKALAPGSHLIIAHGSTDTEQMATEHLAAARENYERTVATVRLRTRAEVTDLFTGFELVEPGVVWLPRWRPDPHDTPTEPTLPLAGYGGIGAKPANP